MLRHPSSCRLRSRVQLRAAVDMLPLHASEDAPTIGLEMPEARQHRAAHQSEVEQLRRGVQYLTETIV